MRQFVRVKLDVVLELDERGPALEELARCSLAQALVDGLIEQGAGVVGAGLAVRKLTVMSEAQALGFDVKPLNATETAGHAGTADQVRP